LQQPKRWSNPAQRAVGKVRGCVVPHIDFSRGGAVEALAYEPMLNEEFDTIVVLGIAHSGVHYPFCATLKDYDTPLGVCHTDRDFVQALKKRLGKPIIAEELAHKNEHSVEFVAVFLQHLEKFKSTKIVPILCGGFFARSRRAPHRCATSRSRDLSRPLRDVVSEWETQGKRVGFIASVDGAHVGSRFGDERLLFAERLMDIERQDREF
jgi:AmmeMemoRadiSam system protein B